MENSEESSAPTTPVSTRNSGQSADTALPIAQGQSLHNILLTCIAVAALQPCDVLFSEHVRQEFAERVDGDDPRAIWATTRPTTEDGDYMEINCAQPSRTYIVSSGHFDPDTRMWTEEDGIRFETTPDGNTRVWAPAMSDEGSFLPVDSSLNWFRPLVTISTFLFSDGRIDPNTAISAFTPARWCKEADGYSMLEQQYEPQKFYQPLPYRGADVF